MSCVKLASCNDVLFGQLGSLSESVLNILPTLPALVNAFFLSGPSKVRAQLPVAGDCD